MREVLCALPHTSLCLSYFLGLERSPHVFPLPPYPTPCYSPLWLRNTLHQEAQLNPQFRLGPFLQLPQPPEHPSWYHLSLWFTRSGVQLCQSPCLPQRPAEGDAG